MALERADSTEVQKPGTLPKAQMLAGGIPESEQGQRSPGGVEPACCQLQ